LKSQGIKRMSRRGRPPNPERHQQIIDFAAQGWTRHKIADHLGITPEWVRAVLAQYGFVVSLRILKCPGCGAPVAKGHKALQNSLALCKNCLHPGKVLSFGQRLKSFRLAENLSLEELSYRSGLSKTMIGNYERDEANPTDASAQKLADSLGLSLSAFHGEFSSPDLADPHALDQ